MTTQTYTPDQLNSVAKSYEKQVCKLMEDIANKDLTILALRTELAKKEKQFEEKSNLLSDMEGKMKETKTE